MQGGTSQSCDLEIRVRYAETDRMGYLHHSRYLVYFEMGRTELLRRQGIAYRDLEDAGVFFAVVRASVRYLWPARYDDLVVLTTRIERVGAARIDHAYTLCDKQAGRLLTEAQTTLACVGRDGRVIPLPESMRRACGHEA